MRASSLSALLLASTVSTSVSAVTVYTNDFTNPAAVGSGVTDSFNTAGGGLQDTIAPYDSTYGKVFRNDTTNMTTLTLSNLPSHGSVNVSFLLAFLDSWDSTNGSVTPDYLDFYVDGNLLHHYTYNNASGTVTDIGGGNLIAQGIQFDGNIWFTDTIVDMAGAPELNIPHSASTLTLGWQASGAGWQGGLDEAWAIDNLQVNVDGTAVPVPPALTLFLAGVTALTTLARRRPA